MADEQKSRVEGHDAGAKAQPSGPKGDTPATAGKSETKVTSGASEQSEGELNPAAPGNTGTTPGTVSKLG